MVEHPDPALIHDMLGWLNRVIPALSDRISNLERFHVEHKSAWIASAHEAYDVAIYLCRCELLLQYVMKHSERHQEECTRGMQHITEFRRRVAYLPELPIYGKLPTAGECIAQREGQQNAVESE